MEKRTKLAIVIIVALILLLLGLWFLLSPFVKLPSAQPPSLPNSVTPYVPAHTTLPTKTVTSTGTTAPVSDLLLKLSNEARATVERIGSGDSADGFLGYHDALLQMTANGQAAEQAEQQRMQQAHSASGPAFGVSTRSVSSNVVSGAAGDQSIVISVDAIQRQDSGNPGAPTKTLGKRVTVTFVKQADGTYLIDSIVWADLAL
jgi:hypothetical protein